MKIRPMQYKGKGSSSLMKVPAKTIRGVVNTKERTNRASPLDGGSASRGGSATVSHAACQRDGPEPAALGDEERSVAGLSVRIEKIKHICNRNISPIDARTNTTQPSSRVEVADQREPEEERREPEESFSKRGQDNDVDADDEASLISAVKQRVENIKGIIDNRSKTSASSTSSHKCSIAGSALEQQQQQEKMKQNSCTGMQEQEKSTKAEDDSKSLEALPDLSTAVSNGSNGGCWFFSSLGCAGESDGATLTATTTEETKDAVTTELAVEDSRVGTVEETVTDKGEINNDDENKNEKDTDEKEKKTSEETVTDKGEINNDEENKNEKDTDEKEKKTTDDSSKICKEDILAAVAAFKEEVAAQIEKEEEQGQKLAVVVKTKVEQNGEIIAKSPTEGSMQQQEPLLEATTDGSFVKNTEALDATEGTSLLGSCFGCSGKETEEGILVDEKEGGGGLATKILEGGNKQEEETKEYPAPVESKTISEKGNKTHEDASPAEPVTTCASF